MRATEKVYKDSPISPFQQEEQKYGHHRAWWTPATWPCMCSFLLLFAFIALKCCCYGLNLKTALTMRREPLSMQSSAWGNCQEFSLSSLQTSLCLLFGQHCDTESNLLVFVYLSTESCVCKQHPYISASLFGIFFSSSLEMISLHTTSQSLAEEMIRRSEEEEWLNIKVEISENFKELSKKLQHCLHHAFLIVLKSKRGRIPGELLQNIMSFNIPCEILPASVEK